MDAFGGVGGIFGVLLQTGNYQLGTGVLAAGSGRNKHNVAASVREPVSGTASASDVYTSLVTIFITPGTSIRAVSPTCCS